MTSTIGIVGSGVSGLHLGLYLRQHDVPVTIYAERSPDEVRASRLLNTVGHHHHTLERERQLGVHHWDAQEYGYSCHNHTILTPDGPLSFRGDFAHNSSVIDYRLYLPKLMEDFAQRGGELVERRVTIDDIERVSQNHELMVVAAGRGAMGELFPRRPDKSPYTKPQRRLSAGIYAGVTYTQPKGVGVHFSPGHGELLELPIFSHDGFATALLFENVPGGDLEVLADIRFDDDPAAFNALVLEKVRKHYPAVAERIDESAFTLWSGRDILQGALTPVVRQDYARLNTGTYAIAVGDAHCVVDPMMGQGANSASFSAWTIGEAIVADHYYDERFCQRVARNRERFVTGVSDWTNLMLNPPPHVMEFIGAMSQDKELCDEFTRNFNNPPKQVDVLATPERTRAYLQRRTDLQAAQPAGVGG
jgi:2-polyprenyl-6-methoxyphenol hydroxylase-like FAD-dependent oxidoreductase